MWLLLTDYEGTIFLMPNRLLVIAVREALQEKKDELEDVRSAFEALKDVAKQTEIANFELRSALNKLTARLNDASAEASSNYTAERISMSHRRAVIQPSREETDAIYDSCQPSRIPSRIFKWLSGVPRVASALRVLRRRPQLMAMNGEPTTPTSFCNRRRDQYEQTILCRSSGKWTRTLTVARINSVVHSSVAIYKDLAPLPILSDLSNITMDALYAAARLLEDASSDASLAYPSSSPHIRQPLAPSQFPFTYQCPPPPTGRTSDEKVVAVGEAAQPAVSQASEIENAELEPERPTKRQCRRRLPSNQEAFENWLLEYPEETTCDSRFRVLRRERRWIRVFKFKEHKVICRKCDKEVQLNKKDSKDESPWLICAWIDHRNYSCKGIYEAFLKARKTGQLWDGESEW
ncbi:hypothetical protein BDZ89DRAFT_1037888 [Hymenopellis radicata]|nr:hypothetical protein BDZ89DRAFT_1037888 [Hymenopellis radicata]